MRVAVLFFYLMVGIPVRLLAADAPPPLDIILALDNSGSMKKNDPLRLLPRVVTEFAGRLGHEDRLGIVAFDQTARTLLPLSQAKASNFAAALSAALQQVNYSGRLTDIPGGLEEARKGIEARGRSEAQRIIVLLTDGDIDLGSDVRNSDRKIWLRDSILPAVSRQGVRIFGITLTADADVELVQRMAEATEGNYYKLLKADEIPTVFSGILTRLQELRDKQVADQAAAEAKVRKDREEADAKAQAETKSRAQAEAAKAQTEAANAQVEAVKAQLEAVRQAAARQGETTSPSTQWFAAGAAVLAVLVAAMLILLRRNRAPNVLVPAARLIDLGGQTGEAEHRIKGPVTRIGFLDDQNDIVVKAEGMSRLHALITFRDNSFHLRDLKSMNYTFLNDVRISPDDESGKMLRHGDILRFGPYSFRFLVDQMTEAEKSRDGQPGVRETVRLDQPFTQRIPAGGDPGAPAKAPSKPGDTLQKPVDQDASSVKPGVTLLKADKAIPAELSSAPHAVGPIVAGDHCAIHQSRGAVVRCAQCGLLICDLEEPIDEPGGGKACREFVERGSCPRQGAPNKVSETA